MKAEQFFLDALARIPADLSKRMDWSFEISDKLAAYMEREGLSRKDFAKRVGKRESEIALWLGGQHNFKLSTLAKISTIIGEDLIRV